MKKYINVSETLAIYKHKCTVGDNIYCIYVSLEHYLFCLRLSTDTVQVSHATEAKHKILFSFQALPFSFWGLVFKLQCISSSTGRMLEFTFPWRNSCSLYSSFHELSHSMPFIFYFPVYDLLYGLYIHTHSTLIWMSLSFH